jgi:hypothetical protein
MAIEYGTGWRLVSDGEFQEFLRRYPRPIIADPPLSQKARFRRFLDPSLGPWPISQIATVHRAHRSTIIVIRTKFPETHVPADSSQRKRPPGEALQK